MSILAFGSCVYDALLAYDRLKQKNINVNVFDMRFIKPLDINAIKLAASTGKIICVEDGILSGGVGQSVLHELYKLNLNTNVKTKILGIDDKFITHGSIDKLKTTANIDSNAIENAVVSILS